MVPNHMKVSEIFEDEPIQWGLRGDPYLWQEMRKRRYKLISPPRTAYMLLPFLRLSEKERSEIIFQEMQEGKSVWVDMETKIDGVEITVRACKDWGALLFGNKMMMLPEYPLQEILSITPGDAAQAGEELKD